MKVLTEYYMWTEIDINGEEGSIMINVPGLGNINLIARKKEIIEKMRAFAEAHQRASGHQIRLVRWTHREDVEVINAKV